MSHHPQMGHGNAQLGIYPRTVSMQGQPQMGIYPQRASLQGTHPQMGSFLSDILGVELDLSKTGTTLLTQGTEGAKAELAAQVVGNKDVQTMAYQASQKTLADKISFFLVKNQKMIATGVIAVGGLWAINKFVLKKARA